MRVVHDFRFRYVKKCHCQSRCLPLLFSRLLASLIEVSARSSVRSSLLPSVRWFVRPFVRPSVRRLHTRNTILGLNFDKHMNKLYHFRDNSETDLRADNQNTSNVQWRSHLIFHPTSFFRLSRSPSITSNVICLKIDRFLANLNDKIQLLIESEKFLSFFSFEWLFSVFVSCPFFSEIFYVHLWSFYSPTSSFGFLWFVALIVWKCAVIMYMLHSLSFYW